MTVELELAQIANSLQWTNVWLFWMFVIVFLGAARGEKS